MKYFQGTKEDYNILQSKTCILYFWDENNYCCKLNDKDISQVIISLENVDDIVFFIVDVNNKKIKNFIHQFGMPIVPSIIFTTNYLNNGNNQLNQVYYVDDDKNYYKINCYEFIEERIIGYSRTLLVYNFINNFYK